MISYKLSYFCAAFSLFAALVSAANHHLGLTVVNAFFALWNYEVAEYNRSKENGSNGESDNNETKK